MRQPALIAGASECAALRLVSQELAQLRATLRKVKPRLAWMPWVSLLPHLKTGGEAAPSAVNLGKGVAAQQLAQKALGEAKRCAS